jgi:hypothetical protein
MPWRQAVPSGAKYELYAVGIRESSNVSNDFKMKASTPSEVEEIFSSQKRIDRPLFLDSKPYTPFKWSVFFFYSVIIGLSLWLLFSNFFVGDIPSSGILHFFLVTAFVGVFFVPPVAVYYLLNLLFPTKMLIDEAGVTLLGCGKKKVLKWIDIESIVTEDVSRYNEIVRFIIIRGKPRSLKWGYYFGVDPNSLKDFLILQRSLFASNRNV